MYTHVYLYLWYNWYTPHNWQNRCHLNIPNELFVPCFWLCSYSSNVLPETPIQRGGAYWEDVVVSSKLGCFRFFDMFPDFFQIYFFHDAKKKFGVVTLFHCHSQASFFCKIWMIFKKKEYHRFSSTLPPGASQSVPTKILGPQIKTFFPPSGSRNDPRSLPRSTWAENHEDCAEDPVRDLEEALQIPLQKKVLNLQQVTSWISQRGGFFAGWWKDVFVEKKVEMKK